MPRDRKKRKKGKRLVNVTEKISNGRLQLQLRHPTKRYPDKVLPNGKVRKGQRQRIYISTGLEAKYGDERGEFYDPEYEERVHRLTMNVRVAASLGGEAFDRWLKRHRLGLSPEADEGSNLIKLLEQFIQFQIESATIQESTKQKNYDPVMRDLTELERILGKTYTTKMGSELRDDLRETLKRSNDTVTRTLNRLSSTCAWAVLEGYIDAPNPFSKDLLKRPKSKTKDKDYRAFSEQQRDAIIEAFASDRYCPKGSAYKHSLYLPFVKLMFMLGTRPGELVALTWGQIASDFSSITINDNVPADMGKRSGSTKTGKSRHFQLNKTTSEYLEELKPDDALPLHLVVPRPRAQDKTADFFHVSNFGRRAWRRVQNGLVEDQVIRRGETLGVYNMRHTAITLALRAGLAVADVAKICGNSPKIIYEHYAQADDSVTMPDW